VDVPHDFDLEVEDAGAGLPSSLRLPAAPVPADMGATEEARAHSSNKTTHFSTAGFACQVTGNAMATEQGPPRGDYETTGDHKSECPARVLYSDLTGQPGHGSYLGLALRDKHPKGQKHDA
jgi:hypothetical protein